VNVNREKDLHRYFRIFGQQKAVPVTLHGHLCHRRSRIGGVGRYNGPNGARQGVYFGSPAPLQFGQNPHDFRAIRSVARFFADTTLEARSARGQKKYESDHSYMSNGRDRSGASGSKRSFPQKSTNHSHANCCLFGVLRGERPGGNDGKEFQACFGGFGDLSFLPFEVWKRPYSRPRRKRTSK
jgi:hypothetical protein